MTSSATTTTSTTTSSSGSSNVTFARTMFPEEKAVQAIVDNKPTFRNKRDALALLIHCLLKQKGFRLVGYTEEETLPESADVDCPPGWNNERDSYSFRYKHNQSSLTFMFKLLVLGDALLIHCMTLEDSKIQSIEVKISDFINPTADLTNYSNLYQNVKRLYDNLQVDILNKVAPGLGKEGYEPGPVQQTDLRDNTSRTQRPPLHFDTPLAGERPGYVHPPRFPMPGVMGPFAPIAPGGPGYPDPDGYGNLIGPHHPGFGMQIRDPRYGYDDGSGMYPGIPGRLPPGAVPPGARFDPFGPTGGPFGPGGGGRPPFFG
eukprot:TRINITY_DN1881_c0_g1_i1.p1 TRINITY_DN1881_c0_g1~~TRINITY_DN1881_c0_g1_i1.p1  ORF type:complete len:317 (+),score=46.20 TRINITY_DN1881_c0_g1_i1:91-1041(+)